MEKQIMTEKTIIPKLKELAVGCAFYFLKKPGRPKVIYEVVGEVKRQSGIGSHMVRLCKNIKTGEIESKCCTSRVVIMTLPF